MNALDNRIPPPFMTLIVGAAMWALTFVAPPYAFGGAFRVILVAAFLVAGGLFAFPAFMAFRRAKTTIDPVHIDRPTAVVSSGVYGFTRNPMYVGLTCLLLSWAMFLSVPWCLIGPLFFVAYITRFQILPEERAMQAKFGAEYSAYRSRVRRWI